MKNNFKPIAITQGDPAGIGPEIVAKAFRDAPDVLRGCFVVGNVATLRRAAGCIARPGIPSLPVAVIEGVADALDAPRAACQCCRLLGLPSAAWRWAGQREAGRAAADCVQWAARAALRGEVAALVTAPLHKRRSLLQAWTTLVTPNCCRPKPLPTKAWRLDAMPVRMMLASDELRTVLVSIHVSLRDAIAAVTEANVLQTVQIAPCGAAAHLGGVRRASLWRAEPHAGEGGLFGREELEIIAPALAQLRAQGMDVHGPLPPDTVFMRARDTEAQSG